MNMVVSGEGSSTSVQCNILNSSYCVALCILPVWLEGGRSGAALEMKRSYNRCVLSAKAFYTKVLFHFFFLLGILMKYLDY